MMGSARNRFPFTASQWQELEHQALIFKYMVSGMSIPPDLLHTVRRSLDSSISSKLLLHQPQLGWNCFQMGFGRKIDPEPGRCRRTDGKKWRCSKEAYPDSKYCERHMHRGRNRSRKPVELITSPPPPSQIPPLSSNSSSSSSTAAAAAANPPTAIPISSLNKPSPSSPTSHHSFSCLTSLAHSKSHPGYASTHFNQQPNFFYSHSSSSRPPGNDFPFSSQENASTTNFFLDSSTAYSHAASSKCYSGYGQGAKEEVTDPEHAFFSEPSGTVRSFSGSSMEESSWHLAPLTMCSPLSQMKQQQQQQQQQQRHSSSHYLQFQGPHDKYSVMASRRAQNHETALMLERDDQPKKVMHHFFDEWPPKDKGSSWLNSAADHDKHSKIQLSISMPNSSSHDFFLARNDK